MSLRIQARPSIAGTPELVTEELDRLATDIERFRAGAVAEPVFLENRLRFGIYGQRQDGVHMLRSKLPLGLVDAEQLEAFADVAEIYGGGTAHLTTRQDIQVHFVALGETPDVLRLLDRARTTTREACGNVVRNVTASPVAGIEAGEAFDVTPHGLRLARFLLRHPDGQSLGRKFKIHLAGSDDERWNLGAIHDVGLTALVRDGERGFRVVVGGGLGPVPYEAQEYTPFLPADELLTFVQAVVRVFAIHGEKKNRARARLKFLLASWGIDRLREEVEAERARLGPAWIDDEASAPDAAWDDEPLHPPGGTFPVATDDAEARWLATNVALQRQPGYAAVSIRVPRGDLGPAELRGLARIARVHAGETLRVTPEQSLLLRWVPLGRLREVHEALATLGLAEPYAQGLTDVVTCPGADTCKLGITSPRAIETKLAPLLNGLARDPKLASLRIKISGCPNACAQHHIADIGFFGASRTFDGRPTPHYVLVLGGRPRGRPGGSGGPADDPSRSASPAPGSGFATTILKLPAARIHEAVARIAALFRVEGGDGEAFADFVHRLGRQRFRDVLADLVDLPAFADAPDAYREPGRSAPFAVVRGVGECAGEAVDASDLTLLDADREVERAEDAHESGDGPAAIAAANAAMLAAARALVAVDHVHPASDAELEEAFRARFYDAGRIFEGVGHTFLAARAERPQDVRGDRLRRLVAEAGLFVEEAHAIVGRLRSETNGGAR